MSLAYERLADDEKESYAEVLRACFQVPSPLEWIEREGVPVCRILKCDGATVGGLMILDMAQYWGGRSLAMGGISAVGIAPEARGGGAARTLMEEAMRELHAAKIPLSALYPATQTLYRKSGFEQAGTRAEMRMDLRINPLQERELALRRLTPDPELVEPCYRAWARSQNGALDRRAANWRRTFRPRGEQTEVYGVGDPLEGYVVLQRLAADRPGHQNLSLTDFVALTPRAARRLYSFLADHRSLAEQVTWSGAPHGPLLTVLAEQQVEVRVRHAWMLRLVDVPAALAERGYSPNLRCELKLSLRDELLPANRGPWWVRIEEGRATVEPAREAGLTLDVRALACLYGGMLTPWQARAAGLLEAEDEELAALDGLFGPPAALSDMF